MQGAACAWCASTCAQIHDICLNGTTSTGRQLHRSTPRGGVISGYLGPFRRASFAHLRDSRCIVVHLHRSVRMPAILPRPFSHPHSHQRQQHQWQQQQQQQRQQQVYPTKRRPRALPRSTTVGTRLPVPRSAPRGLTQAPSESAAAETHARRVPNEGEKIVDRTRQSRASCS